VESQMAGPCNKCVNVACFGNVGATDPVEEGVGHSRGGSRPNMEMGEVSVMRKLVAATVLGATLAFGAGAAFASDNVDYGAPYQPAQSVSNVSETDSGHSMVAGGDSTTKTVYQQLREENFGR